MKRLSLSLWLIASILLLACGEKDETKGSTTEQPDTNADSGNADAGGGDGGDGTTGDDGSGDDGSGDDGSGDGGSGGDGSGDGTSDSGDGTSPTPITVSDLPQGWALLSSSGEDCSTIGATLDVSTPLIAAIDATSFTLSLGSKSTVCTVVPETTTDTEIGFICPAITYNADIYEGGSFACYAEYVIPVAGTVSLEAMTLYLQPMRNTGSGPSADCTACNGSVEVQAVPAD